MNILLPVILEMFLFFFQVKTVHSVNISKQDIAKKSAYYFVSNRGSVSDGNYTINLQNQKVALIT